MSTSTFSSPLNPRDSNAIREPAGHSGKPGQGVSQGLESSTISHGVSFSAQESGESQARPGSLSSGNSVEDGRTQSRVYLNAGDTRVMQ